MVNYYIMTNHYKDKDKKKEMLKCKLVRNFRMINILSVELKILFCVGRHVSFFFLNSFIGFGSDFYL